MGSPVFVGIQRILVAFDASPHAEHALNVALSMAADMKAKLFIIAVIRRRSPPRARSSMLSSMRGVSAMSAVLALFGNREAEGN